MGSVVEGATQEPGNLDPDGCTQDAMLYCVGAVDPKKSCKQGNDVTRFEIF